MHAPSSETISEKGNKSGMRAVGYGHQNCTPDTASRMLETGQNMRKTMFFVIDKYVSYYGLELSVTLR